MIITHQDLWFDFICKHCFQYSNRPRRCWCCSAIYCYDCLKEKPRRYEIDGKFYGYKCFCKFSQSSSFHPVEQFAYDLLKQKCRICEEVVSAKNIILHEANCHFNKQEALNLLKQSPNISINQQNIGLYQICQECKQIQFDWTFLIQTYNQSIICKNCVSIQFQGNQKFQLYMSEEQINILQGTQYQCPSCMMSGNYLEIQSHDGFCKEQVIDCTCGWKGKRTNFLDHFYECSINQLNKLKIEYEQIKLIEDLAQFNYLNIENEKFLYEKVLSNVHQIVFEHGLTSNTVEITEESSQQSVEESVEESYLEYSQEELIEESIESN